MVTAFHGLALVLYVCSGGILVASLAGGRSAAPLAGVLGAWGAVLAHAAGLAAYGAAFGELPLVGLGPSLSTLGFLIGAFLLAAAALRKEGRPLGLVLLPLIAFLLVPGMALGLEPAGEPPAFRGAWFALHVVLAFLGYAALALSFAAGLMYLLQFRALKGKNFGRTFRFFPSLDTLDRTGRQALGIGFPALSLALVLGWAWTVRFRGSVAGVQSQVIWGVFTWIVFVVALAARAGGADRRRRGAVASVLGFVLVVLAYLILRLALAEGRVFL